MNECGFRAFPRKLFNWILTFAKIGFQMLLGNNIEMGILLNKSCNVKYMYSIVSVQKRLLKNIIDIHWSFICYLNIYGLVELP